MKGTEPDLGVRQLLSGLPLWLRRPLGGLSPIMVIIDSFNEAWGRVIPPDSKVGLLPDNWLCKLGCRWGETDRSCARSRSFSCAFESGQTQMLPPRIIDCHSLICSSNSLIFSTGFVSGASVSPSTGS